VWRDARGHDSDEWLESGAKYLYRGMLIDFEKVIGVRHTLLIFGDSSESVYSKMT
jgi:hypothetical protein